MEKDLILLPDELTYVDGAQVACGFGTVYEGLEKIGISGNDQVLVVRAPIELPGPTGRATLECCRNLLGAPIEGITSTSVRPAPDLMKAMRRPSGDQAGLESLRGLSVSCCTLSSPTSFTKRSRLPVCPRSHANTTRSPSGENDGCRSWPS